MKMNTLQSKPLFDKNNIDNIYYHGHCPDGSCALNVIIHYLGGDPSKVNCVPMTHPYTIDEPFFDTAKDKNNIMVDFSLKYNDLQRLIDVSKTFLILDHHKSAQEDLKAIEDQFKIFDMNQSGAGLAWRYFFPSTPLPLVVTFVEDQDIWTFKHPDTKAFNTVFHGIKQTYEVWKQYLDDTVVQQTILKGRAMLEYETKLVNNVCDYQGHVKIHDIDGVYAIVAYANSTALPSQIGNTLLFKYPYADFSVVFSIKNGRTKYSLRSEDTRYDVSVIAKSFPKGGGHRNASGVELLGLYDALPYPVIEDQHGIVSMLFNNTLVDVDCNESFKQLLQRKMLNNDANAPALGLLNNNIG